MKNSLTDRVGRIISGSLNALINSIENAAPESVMEEAIHEIDAAIDEVRVEMGRVMANQHLGNTKLMEERRKHLELSQKIELAIGENREDLAEAAISQQLDIEAQIPVLETTIGEYASQEKDLKGYILALQAKKREMKDELQQYHDAHKESVKASGSHVGARVEKAASAFDRVMTKATGGLGSTTPADRETVIKLAELEELARKNRIKERLVALKNQVK